MLVRLPRGLNWAVTEIHWDFVGTYKYNVLYGYDIDKVRSPEAI
jgi:hypothetical protein